MKSISIHGDETVLLTSQKLCEHKKYFVSAIFLDILFLRTFYLNST